MDILPKGIVKRAIRNFSALLQRDVRKDLRRTEDHHESVSQSESEP